MGLAALAPSLPLIAFVKVLVSMGFFEEGTDMDKVVVAQAKETLLAADKVCIMYFTLFI